MCLSTSPGNSVLKATSIRVLVTGVLPALAAIRVIGVLIGTTITGEHQISFSSFHPPILNHPRLPVAVRANQQVVVKDAAVHPTD